MRAKALALEVLISEEISPMMQQVSWLRLGITCGWPPVSNLPLILLQYARNEGRTLVRPLLHFAPTSRHAEVPPRSCFAFVSLDLFHGFLMVNT